jgi:radical SAM superfamily enzyme YgiQ (UPF0313 family)
MLLVYPDYTDRDVKGKVSGGSYSEGLASISAVLKQGGHQVSLLHLLYLLEEEDYKKKLKEKGEFDIIGFSVRTTAFPDVQTYIKWTKEVYPDVFIICGSYHCTLVPGEVLAVDGVDAVCIGDGEYAELELCDKMSAERITRTLRAFGLKTRTAVLKRTRAPALRGSGQDSDTRFRFVRLQKPRQRQGGHCDCHDEQRLFLQLHLLR